MAEHNADIDPADVWEDYLAETDSRRLSPQGALAFGFWAAINFEKERHDALVKCIQEMLRVYWADGDGELPEPECIRNARAALALSEQHEKTGGDQ